MLVLARCRFFPCDMEILAERPHFLKKKLFLRPQRGDEITGTLWTLLRVWSANGV